VPSYGPPGPKGEKGNRGQRGAELVGWSIDQDEFCVTPVFYDNSRSTTLNMRSLFESYNKAVEGDDYEVAMENMMLHRAEIENETEKLRQGILPDRR
jgi:hypothetical protein